MLGIDQAVQHKRVERKQRARHYDARIGVRITIGNPPLPPGSHAEKTVVFAATPDGVRVLQPKRRRIGSRCQVDINIGLHGSPFVDQADRSLKVAVKGRAGKGRVHVSGSVDLELIDTKLPDELYSGFTE